MIIFVQVYKKQNLALLVKLIIESCATSGIDTALTNAKFVSLTSFHNDDFCLTRLQWYSIITSLGMSNDKLTPKKYWNEGKWLK